MREKATSVETYTHEKNSHTTRNGTQTREKTDGHEDGTVQPV